MSGVRPAVTAQDNQSVTASVAAADSKEATRLGVNMDFFR
jgi:hypothetical protein